MKKPLVLIIMDGWGIRKSGFYNSVKIARTPNYDSYLKKYPHTKLTAHGVNVGLPKGFQGNQTSEPIHNQGHRLGEDEVQNYCSPVAGGAFRACEQEDDDCRPASCSYARYQATQPSGKSAHERSDAASVSPTGQHYDREKDDSHRDRFFYEFLIDNDQHPCADENADRPANR